MFCSMAKEGTTRWLKGLEGCSCFPKIPRQGSGCWPSKPSFFWPWRSHLGNTNQGSALPCLEQPSSSTDPCGTTLWHPPQTQQPPRHRALKETKDFVLTEPHFWAMCQQPTAGEDDASVALWVCSEVLVLALFPCTATQLPRQLVSDF